MSHKYYKCEGKVLICQIQRLLHNMHHCRDDSDKLMESMSYLDEANELLDLYDDQNYSILRHKYKMLYYKGDTYRSLGKYRDSQ